MSSLPERRRTVKVAHLTSVHPYADPRILLKECTTLAASGYDVTLVAPNAPDDTLHGVRLVPFRSPAGRVRRVTGSWKAMATAAEALDCDIYHIHDPELLPAARRLARRGATVIYDSHEHLTKAVAGRPYLPGPLSRAIAHSAGAYEARVTKRISGVIAATPTIAEQFDPAMTAVVANYPLGDEWSDFAAMTADDYLSRPPTAVYIGAITEERNGPQMVAAAAELETPGAEIHFAGRVEGTPPPSGRNVEYHGLVDRQAVGALLDRSRVGLCVLQPIPNYVESLPTKIFEYMAAGMPVIVGEETTVQADLVRDAGCGLAVPCDDVAALAAAIDSLLSDPEAAFDMGQRGRRAMEEDYTWGPQGAELVRFYDSLVVANDLGTPSRRPDC